MNRRNQRSRFRTIVSSPVTLVLALVLLVWLGRSTFNIHTKSVESERKLADAQANLGRLERNRDLIQTRIADLSTDAGVEASMREKFHAVQPGETVVVIVDSNDTRRAAPPQAAAATTTVPAPAAERSWWQKFLQAIGW